jgi:hypothetical protein
MILPADLEPRSFLGQDAISFSEIGTLARCEKAWNFSYNTEREKTQPSAAMALGSETHRLWGNWWTGTDWTTSDNETAVWLMNRYRDQYLAGSMHHQMKAVELPVAAKLPGGPYFFGFIDGLLYDRTENELWVAELKTTQTLSNADYLAQQLQQRLYVWALRQSGVQVVGAMLDVIRSYKPVRKELPLGDSFDRRWQRWSDPELVPAVAEAMSAVQVRRQLQTDERVPIRNVGSSCSWCSHCAPCFGLDVEILAETDAF